MVAARCKEDDVEDDFSLIDMKVRCTSSMVVCVWHCKQPAWMLTI